MNRTRWIPIVVALIMGFSMASWPPIQFIDLSGADIATRFSILVLFSLLIERTVEIVMSIWRSEEANKREAEVRQLVAAKMSPTDDQLKEAQARLIEYKAETMRWTMPIGFALGLVVSAFGVRALSQFVDVTAVGTDVLTSRQMWWFNMGDIVFTGALLAGGADPIHKLLDLYRKAMEASAAKAAGTKQ